MGEGAGPRGPAWVGNEGYDNVIRTKKGLIPGQDHF